MNKCSCGVLLILLLVNRRCLGQQDLTVASAFEHGLKNRVSQNQVFDGLEVSIEKSKIKKGRKVGGVIMTFRQLSPEFQQVVREGNAIVLTDDYGFKTGTTNGEPFVMDTGTSQKYLARAKSELHGWIRLAKDATTFWDQEMFSDAFRNSFTSCRESKAGGETVWTFQYKSAFKQGELSVPINGRFEIYPHRGCFIKRVYIVLGDLKGKRLSKEGMVLEHFATHGNTDGVNFVLEDKKIAYREFENRFLPSEVVDVNQTIKIIDVNPYRGSEDDFSPAAFGLGDDESIGRENSSRWLWVALAVVCLGGIGYLINVSRRK